VRGLSEGFLGVDLIAAIKRQQGLVEGLRAVDRTPFHHEIAQKRQLARIQQVFPDGRAADQDLDGGHAARAVLAGKRRMPRMPRRL